MLRLESRNADLIVVTAAGKVSRADVDAFVPRFAAAARHAPVNMLLDLRAFSGWTAAGLCADVKFDVSHRRDFARIAVLGAKAWHRWMTILTAPLFRAPMRYFAGDTEAALAWLRGP